jgi:hypothetical protein
MKSTDLHDAAAHGDEAKVRELLATKAAWLHRFDETGWTPLHHAAANGHLGVVECLIAAGANVNASDRSTAGDTPLNAVAGNCSLEMARALIAAGAKPTTPGGMQLCALDKAADRKRGDGPAIYQLMLKATRQLPLRHQPAATR